MDSLVRLADGSYGSASYLDRKPMALAPADGLAHRRRLLSCPGWRGAVVGWPSGEASWLLLCLTL